MSRINAGRDGRCFFGSRHDGRRYGSI